MQSVVQQDDRLKFFAFLRWDITFGILVRCPILLSAKQPCCDCSFSSRPEDRQAGSKSFKLVELLDLLTRFSRIFLRNVVAFQGSAFFHNRVW